MRTYEVLFILSPKLGEEDATTLVGDFRSVAEKSGAKLLTHEAWGRRRLASPIEKLTEGIYHLFVCEAEGELLHELDRRMKNSDQVVRHMIVRTDLDHKRAAKLAARNPKKERSRPMVAEGSSPMASAPAPAGSAAVEQAAPPEEGPAPEAVAAPEREAAEVPVAE